MVHSLEKLFLKLQFYYKIRQRRSSMALIFFNDYFFPCNWNKCFVKFLSKLSSYQDTTVFSADSVLQSPMMNLKVSAIASGGEIAVDFAPVCSCSCYFALFLFWQSLVLDKKNIVLRVFSVRLSAQLAFHTVASGSHKAVASSEHNAHWNCNF